MWRDDGIFGLGFQATFYLHSLRLTPELSALSLTVNHLELARSISTFPRVTQILRLLRNALLLVHE